MKKKVTFFDKHLQISYFDTLSKINIIVSFVLIAITIPNDYKPHVGIGFIIILVIIYAYMWHKANNLTQRKLIIGNSNVIIRIGDLFKETDLKVIAFNEYFDTQVDERIIASRTLNGKFINEYVNNIVELDKSIEDDPILIPQRLTMNTTRTSGKKQKYKLGSVHEYNGYLLTAFTRFDNDNRAFLTMQDYINCLLNFWDQLDIIYANRSVVLPLIGTGITRFKDCDNNATNMTEQEKLDILLWTFKVSRIKFNYPTELTIVIHSSIQDKINFYKIMDP